MNEILANPLLVASIAVVLGILATVGLYYLWKYLKGEQNYPGEAKVEAVLMPILYWAIMFAYRVSEKAVDNTQERLSGIDKRMLAERAYDMLPDTIQIGKVMVPVGMVKKWVSRDQFANMVQDAFDEFLCFYEQAEERFKAELDRLIK